MNKEEILKASRKENKNKDLAEIEVMYQAGSHASRVGALACCLVSLLSSMLAHTMLYSPWIIYFSMIATQWLEWYFKNQMDDGRIEAFDGMSLIHWSVDDKIVSLKEFGCNCNRYDPYKNGDTPTFQDEASMWF